MDFIQQYISQCIGVASNNLRLSSTKIEVVAMLKDVIIKSDNIELDIRNMKKITPLSKLAIRLNDIYNYLVHTKIDFAKISDKFKEHTQLIIKDMNFLLDSAVPEDFKQSLSKLSELSQQGKINVNRQLPIDVDLSKRNNAEPPFEKSESEKIKEKIIFEEEKEDDDMFFHNFEAIVVKPIKPLDTIIKKLADSEFDYEELTKYADIMKVNSELSEKFATDIIANMHRIVARTFLLIRDEELTPDKEVCESLRACLIVIVALVRGKEIDIKNYLNRAEEFGEKIKSLKLKEQE